MAKTVNTDQADAYRMTAEEVVAELGSDQRRGLSGSGKSSFLRLLNRLDEPTEGPVFLDERDYREMPPRELKRRVGMVLQSPYLFPGTVADNICFGPAERGELVAAERISRLPERVGLEG